MQLLQAAHKVHLNQQIGTISEHFNLTKQDPRQIRSVLRSFNWGRVTDKQAGWVYS